MTTLTVPEGYGWVLLAVGPLAFVSSQMMGGPVMKARKEFDVPYPNLYATKGFHKKADEFNRVQRGAQSILESLGAMQACAVIGGLQYPLVTAGGFTTYIIGSHLYQIGYSDVTLDVKTARYKKGGFLKPIGMLAVFVTSCIVAVKSTGVL